MVVQKLCNLIKGIDLFGVPVALVMNKETHYKSLAGSIMSIIAIIFIFAFFWQNFLSFVKKDRAQFTIDNQYQQSPDLIQLNENSFMFALGFEQPNNDFTIYPFFNITVIQTYYIMEGGTKKTQIIYLDMEPCSEKHFSLMGQDKYSKITILNSRNFLCPSLGQKIEAQGLYTNDLFSFIKIVVTRCDPNFKKYDKRTWNPLDCGTQSNYDAYIKYVQRPRFIFYTTNFNIIPANTNKYAQGYIQDQQSFTFSPNFMVKSADIYIKKNIIHTDENVILTKNPREETYLTLNIDEIKETSDYITGSSTFVTLYLRRSPYTITINRSFTKIAELMIQIGGLIKCVFLVLGFFLAKYNRFNFRLELANKLYEFNILNSQKNKGEKQQNNKITISSIEQIMENQLLCNPSQKNLSQNNYSQKDFDRQNANKQPQSGEQESNVIIQDKINLNEDKNTINFNQVEPISAGGPQKSIEILRQAQKQNQKSILLDYVQRIADKSVKIKGSISYFLNYLTFGKCLKTEENLLIKKAQEYSKIDLDIYVILDKLQEIEKLKKIIFSPEQITLFNFIKKPVIKNENQSSKNKVQIENKTLPAKSKFVHQLYLKQDKDQQQQILADNNHFMKERDTFTTFQAYKNLFDAYKVIKNSDEQKDEMQNSLFSSGFNFKNIKNQRQNQKLIKELGEEIQNLFELQSVISQKNIGNSEISQTNLETNNQFQMFLQLSPLNKNHRYKCNKTKQDQNKISKYKPEKQNQNGQQIQSKQQIDLVPDTKNNSLNYEKQLEDQEQGGGLVIQQKYQQSLFSQHKLENALSRNKENQNELASSQFSNSLTVPEYKNKNLQANSLNDSDINFKEISFNKNLVLQLKHNPNDLQHNFQIKTNNNIEDTNS
ncbi:transmembrane protein, putative (macronuclear) [Tetrahymena thermophila SB210]|uniref:Transmembrane protein, putative n=1 Tax=Tetrahymena thermophila (strain SB210) TaxID=312017 RepID=I7MFZ0_TETTS|nr:transmembrane protein, putative [Tetrahymena thermophila SB210]EAS00810.2 transmembrane protein, putative [Tetrahymena thermophila SB210]|eukprot:XP_001021055.2 transmembrane protein, putative [Tetrahymena thermophila SB210]